jgi:hypothetical protein
MGIRICFSVLDNSTMECLIELRLETKIAFQQCMLLCTFSCMHLKLAHYDWIKILFQHISNIKFIGTVSKHKNKTRKLLRM